METAGALNELMRLVLSKIYPRLNPDEVQIILLEAAGRLLAAFPATLGDKIAAALQKKEVLINCNLESAKNKRLQM